MGIANSKIIYNDELTYKTSDLNVSEAPDLILTPLYKYKSPKIESSIVTPPKVLFDVDFNSREGFLVDDEGFFMKMYFDFDSKKIHIRNSLIYDFDDNEARSERRFHYLQFLTHYQKYCLIDSKEFVSFIDGNNLLSSSIQSPLGICYSSESILRSLMGNVIRIADCIEDPKSGRIRLAIASPDSIVFSNTIGVSEKIDCSEIWSNEPDVFLLAFSSTSEGTFLYLTLNIKMEEVMLLEYTTTGTIVNSLRFELKVIALTKYSHSYFKQDVFVVCTDQDVMHFKRNSSGAWQKIFVVNMNKSLKDITQEVGHIDEVRIQKYLSTLKDYNLYCVVWRSPSEVYFLTNKDKIAHLGHVMI